jgi:2-methylisocitrate lyase-like PEP mutase family enzyme
MVARLVEMAGFPAVYMTGYGLSASLIGQPDIGLMTMTEMAAEAARMVAAVNIPVIADGDTGYGGVLNVVRTVREYERAGVAAIQIEDQVLPKRCGHMEGKQLVPTVEMVAKLKAAIHARRSPELVIIARTDARAVNGFADAAERAQAYAEAGADVIFFEAPQSLDEIKTVAKTIGKPLLANLVEHGKTPFLTGEQLAALGYKIVIYPNSALYTATKAVQDMLAVLKRTDSTEECSDRMVKFPQFNEMIGLNAVRELEKSFL